MTSDIKNLKEQYAKSKVNRHETAKNLKNHKKNADKDTIITETESKVNAINYYNSLSEVQKRAFDKELQLKKVREKYTSYLKYVYGENYTLTRFHTLLANICQSVVEKIENGQKVKVCISVPPQHGKLCSNDTLVFTDKGWKKHGDLQVGDRVVSEKGKFVKVINVFPKYFANKKVFLTNGEEIKCHENHEWVVYNRQHHRVETLETKQIEKLVKIEQEQAKVRGHRYNYQIIQKDFLIGEHKNFEIDPYVLGVWLGDGKNNAGTICACEKDRITLDECRKHYPNGFKAIHKTTGVIYENFNGLSTQLHKYGMCFSRKRTEKYIPQDYLTASISQRLELLAGLIDTDGCLDIKHNRVVFTTADIKLKETFENLIATFGWRTTTVENKSSTSTSGIVGKKAFWVIAFNPTINIPCRIERKSIHNFSKQRKVSIRRIEDIAHEEGNCIEVEGGIYCVGKTMIPTHNSMTITETLPSWFIGRNPDLRCIITAYNADIAEKFGDKNRQKVKQFGKELFGIEVSDSQDNKTLFDIKNHQGGMFSTGLNGSLTSNNGALIIVDDPFKNELEANNQSIRDAVWSNFTSSVLTRMRGKGNAIIVIHTRWHEDDLIGRILKNEMGQEWIYVNIPCVWESGIDKLLHRKNGETLCPEIGYDTEWANSMMKTIGKRQWNALYQGKPFIEGGELVKRDYLRFYNAKSRPLTFEELVLSCDLSFGGVNKDNDPCCMTVWGRNGGNHYLLEVINKKLTFTETLERIKYLCGKYPQMNKKLIERKANGQAVIETLNQSVGGFIPFDPQSKSKQERLELCLPYFEAGNVFFPDETLDSSIEELIDQLLRFPKSTHDDFVDTISQYLLNYSYKYNGGIIGTSSVYGTLSKLIRGI